MKCKSCGAQLNINTDENSWDCTNCKKFGYLDELVKTKKERDALQEDRFLELVNPGTKKMNVNIVVEEDNVSVRKEPLRTVEEIAYDDIFEQSTVEGTTYHRVFEQAFFQLRLLQSASEMARRATENIRDTLIEQTNTGTSSNTFDYTAWGPHRYLASDEPVTETEKVVKDSNDNE